MNIYLEVNNMGGGTYSVMGRTDRAISSGYYDGSNDDIFKNRRLSNGMNPNGIKIRESRDSKEHPNSLSIILALDVTGSMGQIPNLLVKDGLPNIMNGIFKAGIKDPQILFLGIGDHTCDRAPLQVGQFESNDELLDKWLTDIFLESGGGGNNGESYLLAWYFAAKHTDIDCFEKRGKKGYLFTIGDEPVLKSISKETLKQLMGDGEYRNYTCYELLEEARKKYEVYHIHIRETYTGSFDSTINDWKEILGDNLIVLQSHKTLAKVITDIISNNNNKSSVISDSDQTEML